MIKYLGTINVWCKICILFLRGKYCFFALKMFIVVYSSALFSKADCLNRQRPYFCLIQVNNNFEIKYMMRAKIYDLQPLQIQDKIVASFNTVMHSHNMPRNLSITDA